MMEWIRAVKKRFWMFIVVITMIVKYYCLSHDIGT